MPASETAPLHLLRRPRKTFHSSVERKRVNHDNKMGNLQDLYCNSMFRATVL